MRYTSFGLLLTTLNSYAIIGILLAFIIVFIVGVLLLRHEKHHIVHIKNRYKSLFEYMHEGFALHEIILNSRGEAIDYRFLEVNQAFEVITGLHSDTLIGQTVKTVLPNTEDYWVEHYGQVAISGNPMHYTNYSKTLKKYFRVQVYSPKPKHFATLFVDVTDEVEAKKKVEDKTLLLETVLHAMGDGVIATDQLGRITLINPVAEALIGHNQQEALGQFFHEAIRVVDALTGGEVENPIAHVLNSGHSYAINDHSLLVQKEGVKMPIQVQAAPILNEENRVAGAVMVFRDATDQQEKQRKIQYLSYHDQLTGLYNRHFFDETIKRLDTMRNLPFSLALVDVNGLKLTNDAFGHQMGDRLLDHVAKSLQSVCREDDVIARIGGDEFVIILPKTEKVEVEALAKRMHAAIDFTRLENVVVSVSIGWATKTDSSQSLEEIFSQAENHMYRRKATESQLMRSRTVNAIMQTLYEHHPGEKDHASRVGAISRKIGSWLGLDEASLMDLEIAGRMHDIGNIAIQEMIFIKEEPLDRAEFESIKRHPEVGYNILKASDAHINLANYILAHQEWYDGRGYPRGLVGDEIPLASRILSIAEAYGAMTEKRPYRDAIPLERVVQELEKNAGTQFDPNLIHLCAANQWAFNL